MDSLRPVIVIDWESEIGSQAPHSIISPSTATSEEYLVSDCVDTQAEHQQRVTESSRTKWQ